MTTHRAEPPGAVFGDRSERPTPRPYQGFQGKVGPTFATSTRDWSHCGPQHPGPRPNVVIVLIDDLGYSDLGSYGSEIATPNLDTLADTGLQFSNFHVTPMCSPTRASLLTGINHHRVGVGQVIEGAGDTGYPGYRGELADDACTAAEHFRACGYSTLMAGKWHLTSQDIGVSAKSGWPLQRGFDRFYGFLGSYTYLHSPPYLIEDNHVVERDTYPDGYYLTDDLTDRAISMIRGAKAERPGAPFFLYLSHAAVHFPLQAKESDIAKYRDQYCSGWDATRQERWRRQLDRGLFQPGTRLPGRNEEPGLSVPAWEDISDPERELFARYMAIYAAMVDNIDQNFGRLRAELGRMGEWDNTIVVVMSDNGASQTGGERGSAQFSRSEVNFISAGGPVVPDDLDYDLTQINEVGGKYSSPAYPRGWAMVSNTPFRLYKMTTHAGGHQIPFILSWPNELGDKRLRSQYGYVTDVLPTLLDLAGVAPLRSRNGTPAIPMDGASLLNVLLDADAPSPRGAQYYEMWGNRAYYRDGWEAVTSHRPGSPFREDRWELYDLRRDPTETDDAASRHPDRLRELVDSWNAAAWSNQVFPLDERVGLDREPRPSDIQPDELTIRGVGPRVFGLGHSVRTRPFSLVIDLDHCPGDEGIVASFGSQAGGFVLFIEDSHLELSYNYYGQVQHMPRMPFTDPCRQLTLDVSLEEDRSWGFELATRAKVLSPRWSVPICLAQTNYLDVGRGRISPVSKDLYSRRGWYPYTGTIEVTRLQSGETAEGFGSEYWEGVRRRALLLQ